jgi:hypothetical protein
MVRRLLRSPRRNPLAYPAGVAPGFDPSHLAAAPTKTIAVVASGATNWRNIQTGQVGVLVGLTPWTPLIDGVIGPAPKGSNNNAGYDFVNYWANCPAAQPITCAAIVRTPASYASGAMAIIGYGAESDSGGAYLRTSVTTC